MLVVLFFQLAVLQQPLPNVVQLIAGMLLVVLGLTFFVNGLEMGLFPIGESLAHALARDPIRLSHLFLRLVLATMVNAL